MTDQLIEALESQLNLINSTIQKNHREIKAKKAEIRQMEEQNAKLQPQSDQLYNQIQKLKNPQIAINSISTLAMHSPNTTIQQLNTALSSSYSVNQSQEQMIGQKEISRSFFLGDNKYVFDNQGQLKKS